MTGSVTPDRLDLSDEKYVACSGARPHELACGAGALRALVVMAFRPLLLSEPLAHETKLTHAGSGPDSDDASSGAIRSRGISTWRVP